MKIVWNDTINIVNRHYHFQETSFRITRECMLQLMNIKKDIFLYIKVNSGPRYLCKFIVN